MTELKTCFQGPYSRICTLPCVCTISRRDTERSRAPHRGIGRTSCSRCWYLFPHYIWKIYPCCSCFPILPFLYLPLGDLCTHQDSKGKKTFSPSSMAQLIVFDRRWMSRFSGPVSILIYIKFICNEVLSSMTPGHHCGDKLPSFLQHPYLRTPTMS